MEKEKSGTGGRKETAGTEAEKEKRGGGKEGEWECCRGEETCCAFCTKTGEPRRRGAGERWCRKRRPVQIYGNRQKVHPFFLIFRIYVQKNLKSSRGRPFSDQREGGS